MTHYKIETTVTGVELSTEYRFMHLTPKAARELGARLMEAAWIVDGLTGCYVDHIIEAPEVVL